MVNCAYCGKKALVPSEEDHSLDHLLSETLDESHTTLSDLEDGETVSWSKLARGLEPVRIAWTAAFLVLLLSVLLITVRWVVHMVREGGAADDLAGILRPDEEPPAPPIETSHETPEVEEHEAPEERRPRQVPDVFADLDPSKAGVWVGSEPPEMRVYIQPLDEARRRSFTADDYKGVTPLKEELQPGEYRISVAATENHPGMIEYPNYYEGLRRPIRMGDIASAEEFFLDDGAIFSVETLQGRKWLVKSYTVEIGKEGWQPVVCLMLPNLGPRELLKHCSPDPRFRYDPTLAVVEFQVNHVDRDDYPALKELLSRVGKAVYEDRETGRLAVFQVWPGEEVVSNEISAATIPPEAND
jgi:hypothetical protein